MKALSVLLLLVPSPQGHPTRSLRMVVALLLAALVCVWPTAGSQAAQQGPTGVVTVMTQNMDEGSDLGPALRATSLAGLAQAGTDIYKEVVASNIPERAAAVARQIGQTKPDLVGLTEVPLWRTGPLGSPTPSASHVAYDALKSLRDALAQQGLQYTVIVIVSEYDIEGPTTLSDVGDIRLTDQDVILARTDLMPGLWPVQQGHFSPTSNLTVTVLGQQVPILRGWASVDANIRGKTFRFVTTHLESVGYYQGRQATELVQGPGTTALPVVFAGDFNSAAVGGPDPRDAYTYLTTTAGFMDTWSTEHPDDVGFTWPLHGEDPFTPFSTPTERIDLVLSRGGVGVLGVQLIGNRRAALTPSGLWPSDHAGVVATLRIL